MKKLFSIIALVLLSSELFALNVGELKTQIRRNIRDTDLSNPRYSNEMILDLLNEGQNDVNNQTLLTMAVTNYVLTNGTSYYVLPTDYMMPNEVYFKKNTGETIKLSEVKQDKLYQSKPDWDRTRGEPQLYWISDSTYSVSNATVTRRISYIPVPNNLSTGTITMWYYSPMPLLTADSDIPFAGQYELVPFHQSLVYYVTMRLKIIDGIIDEANAYQILYANSVQRISRLFGNISLPPQQAPPAQ